MKKRNTQLTGNIIEQYETLEFEGNLIIHQIQYIVQMIVHNKKALILDFFLPHPSLGSHTVHRLSFLLRIPLFTFTYITVLINSAFWNLEY